MVINFTKKVPVKLKKYLNGDDLQFPEISRVNWALMLAVSSRSERCIYRASRPSQGTVNGGAVSK